MRDSINLISYAGCLNLSAVISAKIHSKCASRPKIAKKISKNPYFCGSRSLKVGTPGKLVSSACYDAQQVCVYLQSFSCYRLVDSSRNRTFSRGYANLMRSYGGLREPRGSSLTPLKSTFNAEHFTCRLSWSILNGFGAIHS